MQQTQLPESDRSEIEVITAEEAAHDDFLAELAAQDEDSLNFGEVLPTMNVQPMAIAEEEPCIVSDEKILGLYDEIVENCRNDREKVDELQSQFEDMVLNEGDATSASKEALVNLMKIKSDLNDKMSKVADLMTRVKLKERDTFPRYLAASQTNNVTIESSSKRDLLKSIHQRRGQG